MKARSACPSRTTSTDEDGRWMLAEHFERSPASRSRGLHGSQPRVSATHHAAGSAARGVRPWHAGTADRGHLHERHGRRAAPCRRARYELDMSSAVRVSECTCELVGRRLLLEHQRPRVHGLIWARHLAGDRECLRAGSRYRRSGRPPARLRDHGDDRPVRLDLLAPALRIRQQAPAIRRNVPLRAHRASIVFRPKAPEAPRFGRRSPA
jgi:hypothetical protein